MTLIQAPHSSTAEIKARAKRLLELTLEVWKVSSQLREGLPGVGEAVDFNAVISDLCAGSELPDRVDDRLVTDFLNLLERDSDSVLTARTPRALAKDILAGELQAWHDCAAMREAMHAPGAEFSELIHKHAVVLAADARQPHEITDADADAFVADVRERYPQEPE